ncbi:MAG: thiosulfate oxidation carrier protein SoxY [Magnetococcales bacterium]|nr:thiosulfate oxidation carrier protein SoxY [Magnetococcales bacterium]
MGMNKEQEISRRSFFHKVGTAGVAVVAAGTTLTSAPRQASASAIDALVAERLGAGDVAYEKVLIDTPPSAENGALVRIPVSVDHPMESDNYIQSIAIFVDNNPKPFVGQFDFTPESGRAAVECRIKMAKTSQVRAIAKTNAGKLYGFKQEIQVAEGGCAG